MTGVLIRRGKFGHRDIHMENNMSKKMPIYKPRRAAWNSSFFHGPQKKQPCQHLDFGLLDSRIIRQDISVFETTQSIVPCCSSHNKYHWPVLAPSSFLQGRGEKKRILKTLQNKMGFFWYKTWKLQQCLHK